MIASIAESSFVGNISAIGRSDCANIVTLVEVATFALFEFKTLVVIEGLFGLASAGSAS